CYQKSRRKRKAVHGTGRAGKAKIGRSERAEKVEVLDNKSHHYNFSQGISYFFNSSKSVLSSSTVFLSYTFLIQLLSDAGRSGDDVGHYTYMIIFTTTHIR